MRLGLLGSPLRLDGVAPRVLSIGGLISIALAQGGLRFRHLGLVAALGPLKSARVHLCAAMTPKLRRAAAACLAAKPVLSRYFEFGCRCRTRLEVQKAPKGARRRLENQGATPRLARWTSAPT